MTLQTGLALHYTISKICCDYQSRSWCNTMRKVFKCSSLIRRLQKKKKKKKNIFTASFGRPRHLATTLSFRCNIKKSPTQKNESACRQYLTGSDGRWGCFAIGKAMKFFLRQVIYTYPSYTWLLMMHCCSQGHHSTPFKQNLVVS